MGDVSSAMLKRANRVREDHVRQMVFEQLPATVRPNVEMFIETDLFNIKLVITLRVIGRKVGSTFEVDQETSRDSEGILHVKVPDNVLAELCVMA